MLDRIDETTATEPKSRMLGSGARQLNEKGVPSGSLDLNKENETPPKLMSAGQSPNKHTIATTDCFVYTEGCGLPVQRLASGSGNCYL